MLSHQIYVNNGVETRDAVHYGVQPRAGAPIDVRTVDRGTRGRIIEVDGDTVAVKFDGHEHAFRCSRGAAMHALIEF